MHHCSFRAHAREMQRLQQVLFLRVNDGASPREYRMVQRLQTPSCTPGHNWCGYARAQLMYFRWAEVLRSLPAHVLVPSTCRWAGFPPNVSSPKRLGCLHWLAYAERHDNFSSAFTSRRTVSFAEDRERQKPRSPHWR